MSTRTPSAASFVFRVAAITFVCAIPARAQSLPQLRDGFALSAGVGAGVASVKCAVCASGAGTSAYARLGGALRPDLILAGDVSTWQRSGRRISASQSDVRVTLYTVTIVAQWYPHVARGFFVETGGGIGVLDTRIKDRLTGTRYRWGGSGGYQLGVGDDHRVKPNLSLTPYATFFGAAPSHMSDDSESVHGNALQIGLGLTMH